MRHLRLYCASLTLILALAFSAYAGDIECDGKVSAPAPSDYSLTEALVVFVDGLLSLV